jgi:class 3 adenylate cyclase
MSGVAIVVFSDLVDSTALLASLGDDRMDMVRRAHVVDVTEAVAAGGGRVVKTLGDGVMASFGSALGALRAAAAIQVAVERLARRHGEIGIAARVGVAAGEPIPDGEDLHGMTVVIASRLSSAASSGEVLVQELVQALVASRDGVKLADARDYELKGVPGTVRAARLGWRDLAAAEPGEDRGSGTSELSATAPDPTGNPTVRLPPVLAAYADEPLIGRDREIAALREASAPRPGRRATLVSTRRSRTERSPTRSSRPREPVTGCFVASARRCPAPRERRRCTSCSTTLTGATPPPCRHSSTCWTEASPSFPWS